MAPAVISTGAIHGGDPAAPSVVPEVVRVTGTARSFTPEVRDLLEDGIRRAADSAAALYGVAAVSDYLRRYPPTVNAADCVDVAYRAAVNVAGEAAVDRNCDAMAGAEDFSFMAQEVPGAYVFIGNGPGENGCELHAPTYDFNDEIIAPGVRYWLNLVETELPHS